MDLERLYYIGCHVIRHYQLHAAKLKNPRRSHCDFVTMSNLGAVRHLGFDHQSIEPRDL